MKFIKLILLALTVMIVIDSGVDQLRQNELSKNEMLVYKTINNECKKYSI